MQVQMSYSKDVKPEIDVCRLDNGAVRLSLRSDFGDINLYFETASAAYAAMTALRNAIFDMVDAEAKGNVGVVNESAICL